MCIKSRIASPLFIKFKKLFFFLYELMIFEIIENLSSPPNKLNNLTIEKFILYLEQKFLIKFSAASFVDE